MCATIAASGEHRDQEIVPGGEVPIEVADGHARRAGHLLQGGVQPVLGEASRAAASRASRLRRPSLRSARGVPGLALILLTIPNGGGPHVN